MANDPTDTNKYKLGTSDMYVGARNASDLDKGLNAGNTTFTNRFGKVMPTFEKAISDAKANYGGLNSRGDWVTLRVYAVNDLWQSTVDDTWYLVLTAYTSGANEAADIASGNVQVFQGIARQDSVIKIASVFDVDAFARLEEGNAVELISYHPNATVGGGPGITKLARHNGGTAISLSRVRPTDWTDQAQLTAWFADSGSDELCFFRGGNTFSSYEFGAKRDGVTDDSKSDAKAFEVNGFNEYDGKTDVIIVYGQSNAVGLAGQTNAAAADDYATPERAFGTWNYDPTTDSIIPISQTMETVNGEFSRGNAWTSFANEWVKRTGRQCVIVNCALGGAEVAVLSKGNTSNPSTGGSFVDKDFYGKLVSGYSSTKSAMQSSGLTIGDTYLVYHQGETDMSLGTTFTSYVTLLTQLFTDLKTDVPDISKFGIAIVGSPESRNQFSWQTIQSAQYKVATGSDLYGIVYEGCPSFDLKSGQYNSADQTHYSQRGYNQLGQGIATGLYEWVSNSKQGSTALETGSQNYLTTNGYGKMQYVSATALSTDWSLLRGSNTPADNAIYPCYIRNIIASPDDDLVFSFSGSPKVFYSVDCSIGYELGVWGIRAVANRYVDGDEKGVRVRFFGTFTILVNVSSGAILGRTPPIPTGAMNGIFSVTTSSGIATITHPRIEQMPTASYYSTNSMEVAGSSVRCDSNMKTRVTTDGTNEQVQVVFRDVPLTRTQMQAFGLFEVNVTAVVAEETSSQI